MNIINTRNSLSSLQTNENPYRDARLDPNEMIERWSANGIEVDYFETTYVNASNSVQKLKDLLELSSSLDMPHEEIDNFVNEMIKKVEIQKLRFHAGIDNASDSLMHKLKRYSKRCRDNMANVISNDQILMFKRVQSKLKEWKIVLNDPHAKRDNWKRIKKESKENLKLLLNEIRSINLDASLNQLVFYQLMCLGFSQKKIPQHAIQISTKLFEQ